MYTLFHIDLTGPMLGQLNDAIHSKVASKWYDLGVKLLGNTYEIDIIKYNYPNNAEACCTEMFKVWLQRDANASWSNLVSALRAPSMGLHVFAKELNEKFTNRAGKSL